MKNLILVINPGSTSTKIAVYENRKSYFLINIKHSLDLHEKFKRIADQFEFRKEIVLNELKKASIEFSRIAIMVTRGGLLKPITGGAYKVNEKMIYDIHHPMAEHESNLGGLIAFEIAREIGGNIPAIIVDPTCVDEMEDISRISGMPELPRLSFLHSLNQRAVARRFSIEIGKNYDDINLIVVHMGGGISAGAHRKGRIIDVNNGLNGEGPMSPERSGGVPSGQLVELCFSGKFNKDEIMKKLKGKGGLCAYLETSDAIEIEKRIANGDKYAELIFMAIPYQVAKEIGALSTVLKGEVEGILLTGGLAFSNLLVNDISERVKHLGIVKVYPGEDEMETLALYGYMALNNEIEVKEYI